MRLLLLTILVLLTLAASLEQAHALTVVGNNVDIGGENPSDRQRVEPTIAVDPRNPSITVAGAQDLSLKPSGHRWLGYYRSIDGGATWSVSLLPGFPGDNSAQGGASPLFGSNTTSDPVLTFDGKGNVYYTGLVFNVSSTGVAGKSLVFVAKYGNDGADYSSTTLITSIKNADKPWIIADTTGGSNNGDVYLGVDGGVNGRFTLVFTRSTDGGRTFSDPILVNQQGGFFPGLAVDSNSNFYVSSLGPGSSDQRIFVSKSTDGGVSFRGPVVVAKISPLPTTTLPGNSFRVFTIPQIAADSKGVYVVWDSFAGDQANILLARSTDGGQTWQPPVMVNERTLGQHFFPTLAVSGGIVSVAWYDSRVGQLSNGTITGLNLYYSESRDAGASFSANLRVSSKSFNPNLVKRTDAPGTNHPFLGDYISMAASPTAVHPIWTDNRNACDTADPAFGCVDQDAFTAIITP